MTVRVEPGYHHYQFRVHAGRHTLIADVGHELQGDDSGPDPHQLIEAALAVCTAQTLAMYAERKQWPLQGVHVAVQVDSTAGGNRFQRRIELNGELSDEQRQRLLEIANKCPIHRILTGAITVQSDLVASLD